MFAVRSGSYPDFIAGGNGSCHSGDAKARDHLLGGPAPRCELSGRSSAGERQGVVIVPRN
jgi:hypothetical protein